MEKKSFYYFSLAAILAGSLASCQEADQGFSAEEIARAKFEKEYRANFERDYGKIAPGHTWGFDVSSKTRSSTHDSYQYKVNRSRKETVNSYYIDKAFGEYVTGPVEGQCDFEDLKYINENCPGVITDEERTYVFQYLQDHPDEGSLTCEMDNYFLQNLGQNKHKYMAYSYNNGERSSTPNKEIDNEHMEQLWFDETHFKDYNGSGYGVDYYVTNTSITVPTYNCTLNGDEAKQRVYNKYRFYYIPGYGVYLCFDFCCDSANEYYEGDGKYDDWVIKVAPGEGETVAQEYRVFCEDLGSTFDLDFNDLVFDYVELSPNKSAISVRALEGTLPIAIDGHDLKGNDLTPHHNVTMDVIYVDKAITASDLISVKTNRGTCFIANTPGEAPYLLRCDITTDWPAENQRIDDKYSSFSFYVTENTQPFWWNTNN